MNIEMRDIAAAGICASGCRRWFNEHGLDFRDFMKNGIDADDLLATGDAYAQLVVDKKLERLAAEEHAARG